MNAHYPRAALHPHCSFLSRVEGSYSGLPRGAVFFENTAPRRRKWKPSAPHRGKWKPRAPRRRNKKPRAPRRIRGPRSRFSAVIRGFFIFTAIAVFCGFFAVFLFFPRSRFFCGFVVFMSISEINKFLVSINCFFSVYKRFLWLFSNCFQMHEYSN